MKALLTFLLCLVGISLNAQAPPVVRQFATTNQPAALTNILRSIIGTNLPSGSNAYIGSFTGNGAGLTNLSVGWTGNPNQFDASGGQTNIKSGVLLTNAYLYSTNTLPDLSGFGSDAYLTYDGNVDRIVTATGIQSPAFTGGGSGLTALPAAQISGTLNGVSVTNAPFVMGTNFTAHGLSTNKGDLYVEGTNRVTKLRVGGAAESTYALGVSGGQHISSTYDVLRMERTGTGARTWNFLIDSSGTFQLADITGGSLVPFQFLAGTKTATFITSASGIGVGANPYTVGIQAMLHVTNLNNNANAFRVDTTAAENAFLITSNSAVLLSGSLTATNGVGSRSNVFFLAPTNNASANDVLTASALDGSTTHTKWVAPSGSESTAAGTNLSLSGVTVSLQRDLTNMNDVTMLGVLKVGATSTNVISDSGSAISGVGITNNALTVGTATITTANVSNNIAVTAAGRLFITNATDGRVVMDTAAGGLTNVGVTGVLLGTGAAATFGDIQTLTANAIVTNTSTPVLNGGSITNLVTSRIVAGSGVTTTTNNPGAANETLTIAASGGSLPDSRTNNRANVYAFEEFVGRWGTAAPIGVFGFYPTTSGSGSHGMIASLNGVPGIYQLNTGTTSGGTALTDNKYGSSFPYMIGNGVWTNEWRFRIQTIGDGTDDPRLCVGLISSIASLNPDDGVFIRYDTNNTVFQWVVVNNTTPTVTNTTTTCAANTWYKATAIVTATSGGSTNVVLTINDADSITLPAANIPVTRPVALGAYVAKLRGSTVNFRLDLDYCSFGYAIAAR